MGALLTFPPRGRFATLPTPPDRRTAMLRGEALRELFTRADAAFTEDPTPAKARAVRAAKLQLVAAAQACFAPMVSAHSGAYTMALFDAHLDRLCPAWRTAPIEAAPGGEGSAA